MRRVDTKKFTGLGRWLKSWRVDAGLTQLDISQKLGYSSAQFVSDWERGVSAPPSEIVSKLIKVLGIPKVLFLKIILEEQKLVLEKNLGLSPMKLVLSAKRRSAK